MYGCAGVYNACLLCRCVSGLYLYSFQLDAPFIPKTKGAGDTSNFDEYDEEPLRVASSEKYASEFADF